MSERSLREKSPKVVRMLLSEGFNLVGAGRGRLVFGKPRSPVVFKVSWRLERTRKDMNEIEWKHYQNLSLDQKKLVVPLLDFYKLRDGNSVLVQARASPVDHPTVEERAAAKKIMETVRVSDHVPRNFGYYQGELRILDVDSPVKPCSS